MAGARATIAHMRCARCGSSLDDDAKVCGQCGAVVGASYGTRDGQTQFAPRSPAFPAAAGLGETPRLLARVKSILRSPRTEWPAIAREPTTATEIYTGYALPLAAIGALALALSQVMIGVPAGFFGFVKASLAAGVAAGLLLFALALVHLYLLAWIVDGMAKRFGGEPDRMQALKLAAYSYTPLWLAGVLYLVPMLSIVWAPASLYAMYLAFIGLPQLMRCRPERAAPYAIAAGACAFALALLFGGLVTALTGFGPGIFD